MIKLKTSKFGYGLLTTLVGMLLASSASAVGTVSSVSCSEIAFNTEVVHYPDINEACLGIVDYEGGQFAKLQGKVVRVGQNTLLLKYMHSDGNYGESYRTTELPAEFRVFLDGKKTRISDLSRDQILNVYVKIGSEMATLMEPESAEPVAEVTEATAETAPEPVKVTMVAAPAMLPKTAGWFYEILLAGFALLVIAGSMTFARVRSA